MATQATAATKSDAAPMGGYRRRLVQMSRERGVWQTLTRISEIAGTMLGMATCILRVKMQGRNPSIEKMTDLVLGCEPLKPLQIRSEVVRFLEVVRKEKPKTLVEIGTAKGGTLLLLCRVVSPEATIISIDLPQGPYGGGYPAWAAPFYRAFARRTQKIHLLRANSHTEETRDRLRAILNGQTIDFLFIDGDHTYPGARQDFELYSPLVTPGGMIGFHDIAPNSPSEEYGVPQIWTEVKSGCRNEEMIEDLRQRGYGIGLLWTKIS